MSDGVLRLIDSVKELAQCRLTRIKNREQNRRKDHAKTGPIMTETFYMLNLITVVEDTGGNQPNLSAPSFGRNVAKHERTVQLEDL